MRNAEVTRYAIHKGDAVFSGLVFRGFCVLALISVMFGCVHSSGVDVWQCLFYSKQQSAQILTVIRHSNLMSNNIKQLFFLGFDQEQFKSSAKNCHFGICTSNLLIRYWWPFFVKVYSGMITMILFSLEWHSLHLYYQ